jgi:hypothetical protein
LWCGLAISVVAALVLLLVLVTLLVLVFFCFVMEFLKKIVLFLFLLDANSKDNEKWCNN